ncbi:hypothetical protein ACFE04_023720 [Oxalis oulophora]
MAKLLLFTIFLFSLLHSFKAAPSNLVSDFCSTMGNPSACLSAIERDPKSATVSKYYDLAKMVVNLAITDSANSLEFIKSSKGKYDPKAIELCIGGFDYAVNSFRGALAEIDVDAQSASYDAAVATDGATTCLTAFKDAKINVPKEISIRVDNLQLYSILGNDAITHLE